MHNTGMEKNDGRFKKGQHWRPLQAFRDAEWLRANYVDQKRSTGDIAKEFGVTDAAVLFWLRRHDIPRRDVSAARSIKHWGPVGSDNPMWNKFGELNPRWLGGVTQERQAFYASREWKDVCKAVWKRDQAKCCRCDLVHDDEPGTPFHIHHIVSFAEKSLRAELSNLILVCEPCHLFIHSRKNVNREYIQKV